MTALDLKKTLSSLYNPPKDRLTLVEVPPMNFLMIDGHGDPNTSPAYQQAVETLYGLAYTLRFAFKKRGVEFTVMPLEGLWWAADMNVFTATTRKDTWDWTMMILQPDEVTAADVEQARAELLRKRKVSDLPPVRFEQYAEGLSVQILYYGAYADEGPTIARMHRYIAETGYQLAGKHHEIYMGDPRRTAPEKLKTILRQPVKEEGDQDIRQSVIR